MSEKYNGEIGYEALLKDFERYRKMTPKGVSLARDKGSILLQFKVGSKNRSKYGCNCSFTLDGMVEALSKANKVAEALKSFTSEIEFWQWYDKEVREVGKVENDLLTFGDAIAKVENDFWSRPDRRRRKRDKNNPSDVTCWNRTYGSFYKHLPVNNLISISEVMKVVNLQTKGTRNYKYVICAMKKLARMSKRNDLLEVLDDLSIIQTEFSDLQTIKMEDFFNWRDKTLGITASLSANADIDTRERWLWVFSMQVVYGLRVHEVFAIQNLDEPFTTKDKVVIPALNDFSNTDNLIVVGEKTTIGTTTKTSYRIARPIIPPKYPNLVEYLDIKTPKLPKNKPESDNPEVISKFFNIRARQRLVNWNAPITQTHAFRHLANINGMQAGIPLEVRAQSLGHTPMMNDSVYKKRQATNTTIDLLLNSNTNAIDFVTGLNEAKKLLQDYPDSLEPISKLIARVYGKNEQEVLKLLS